MKKTLIIGLTMLAGVALAEPPYSMTLSTTSSVVCASRKIPRSQATEFTSDTTYSQGEYVTQSNLMYMCTIPGTVTNASLGITSGEKDVEGGVTMRHIPTDSADRVIPRSAVSIQLISGDPVSITVGSADAVVDKGEKIDTAGSQWVSRPNVTQKEVRAVSAGVSVVAIQEVVED